jgi:hypothetical protein
MRAHLLADEPGTRLVLGDPERRPRIAFDRITGVTLVGKLPRWVVRPARIPIAALDRIRLTVAPDHRLRIDIRYRSGTVMADFSRELAVRHLDVDHEAVDLAFRIANVVKFGGYFVRSTEAAHAIELVRQAPDDRSPYRTHAHALHDIAALAGADVQTVPAILAPASYADQHAPFVEPDPPIVPPPRTGTIAGIEIRRWQRNDVAFAAPRTITATGAVIDALRNAGTAAGMLGVVAVLAVSFEGCRRLIVDPSAGGFYSWKDYLAYGIAWVVLALLGLIVIGLVIATATFVRDAGRALRRSHDQRQARDITLDAETLTIVTDTVRRTIPRREITGVTLRAHAASRHWCELHAMRADEDILLAVTALMPDTSQHPRVTQIAVGLARELDVPFSANSSVET